MQTTIGRSMTDLIAAEVEKTTALIRAKEVAALAARMRAREEARNHLYAHLQESLCSEFVDAALMAGSIFVSESGHDAALLFEHGDRHFELRHATWEGDFPFSGWLVSEQGRRNEVRVADGGDILQFVLLYVAVLTGQDNEEIRNDLMAEFFG